MKKRHFKMRFGYLNVDQQCLYITKSGGWFEAYDLKETNALTETHARRLLKTLPFVLIGASIWVCINYAMDWSIFSSVKAAVAGIALTLAEHVLHSYKSYTIPFKIPWQKVKLLEPADRSLKITFENGAGITDQITLKGLNSEAFGYAQKTLGEVKANRQLGS